MKINKTIYANGRTYKLGQEDLLERDGYTREQRDKWLRVGKISDADDVAPAYTAPEPQDSEDEAADVDSGGEDEEVAEFNGSLNLSGTLAADTEEEDIDATTAAKSLASDNDVDLSSVEGTGSDGRITKPDVEAAIGGEEG